MSEVDTSALIIEMETRTFPAAEPNDQPLVRGGAKRFSRRKGLK